MESLLISSFLYLSAAVETLGQTKAGVNVHSPHALKHHNLNFYYKLYFEKCMLIIELVEFIDMYFICYKRKLQSV